MIAQPNAGSQVPPDFPFFSACEPPATLIKRPRVASHGQSNVQTTFIPKYALRVSKLKQKVLTFGHPTSDVP